MHLGPHAGFIVAAYAVTIIIIGLLTAWVLADYRAQLRLLAKLERQRITRRSQSQRPLA